MRKIYLGDSVYAEFISDESVKLTTENGLPDDPSNVIILEFWVAAALHSSITTFVEERDAG